MSEQNIKNVINNTLAGDDLKNALDFAQFLEANVLTVNGAKVSRNGKAVCYMHLDGGEDYPSPWTIWTHGDYSCEHEDVGESLKEIAWANVNKCDDCSSNCTTDERKVVFGREFEGLCSATMAFHKPGGEILECLKKLLEIRMKDC